MVKCFSSPCCRKGGSSEGFQVIKLYSSQGMLPTRKYTTENVSFFLINNVLNSYIMLLHLDKHASYGYRGRDCRSNLYLLPTGETVYFIASVVVLFNVEEQLQRHYTGHNDDVKW